METENRHFGTVYLLHFDRPYKHARHYIGWARDLDARLHKHGTGEGARLLAVVHAAGITWTLARTWKGPRSRERQIKNMGGASRCCPLCGVRPRPDTGPRLTTAQQKAYRIRELIDLSWFATTEEQRQQYDNEITELINS